MDVSKLTLLELKAYFFDEMRKRDIAEENMKVLSQSIAKKEQEQQQELIPKGQKK